jgi:SAM-dependent methyltransferase
MNHEMPQDDWDDHWNRYAKVVSRNPAQEMRHALVVKLLVQGSNSSECRVLDIGSGQGDLLVKLRPWLPEARLVGFELSESGVAVSQKKVPDATFLVADLFAPPTELKEYEGWATNAVCSEVLEHVDDPIAFLRQARPYLADGAKLIVTVPGGPMSAFDKVIGHRQHFDRESIRRVLEQAGFAVDRVCLAGFPFFNLYRLAIISRGQKLAEDVGGGENGAPSKLAAVGMRIFRFLFRFNFPDSPFGWQVVAVARKASV